VDGKILAWRERHAVNDSARSGEICDVRDLLTEIWSMLIGRAGGPLTFRFVFQPTVAAILAIRAGVRDARKGNAPFLRSVFTNPIHRGELLREGWKDIGTVFMIAVLLDVIYALMVHSWLYPGQTLLVATILSIVPYALIRGPVTRLIVHFTRK